MDTAKIRYWTEIEDGLSDESEYEYARVILSIGECYAGGVSCKITPDGNITLTTHENGGHGFSGHDDKGRSADEWIDLLNEAKAVKNHYYQNGD